MKLQECLFLACLLLVAYASDTLAQQQPGDVEAEAQGYKSRSHKHKHYYDPDPCLEGLPDHYKASAASTSYCHIPKREPHNKNDYPSKEHHDKGDYHKEHDDKNYNKYDKAPEREYRDGYEGDKGDHERCPATPQPISYVNLLRSNDTYKSGTWGAHVVSGQCWHWS